MGLNQVARDLCVTFDTGFVERCFFILRRGEVRVMAATRGRNGGGSSDSRRVSDNIPSAEQVRVMSTNRTCMHVHRLGPPPPHQRRLRWRRPLQRCRCLLPLSTAPVMGMEDEVEFEWEGGWWDMSVGSVCT